MNYEVTITSTSREMSAKERVMVKDFANAISLADVAQEGSIIIDPDCVVMCKVHNEMSDSKDYDKCVILDKSGKKFITGSPTFINAITGIMKEMEGCGEPYQIEVTSHESSKYKGKTFLTCSVL